MASFKSINYPQNKHLFYVVQSYASTMYVRFFSVLMIVLIYALSKKAPLLYLGIFGCAVTLVLSQFAAIVEMKRKIAEIIIVEDQYLLRTVYDVVFNKLTPMIHVSLSNARIDKDIITLTYNQRVITLKKSDWDDWEGLQRIFL